MAIRIIGDSCCDATEEIRSALGLVTVPLTLCIGSAEEYQDDGSVTTEFLIKRMASVKEAAKTACPSIESFRQCFSGSDSCMVVTLSSRLSGSYAAASAAKDIELEKHREKKIHIFDSKSAASGQLQIALMIKELENEGVDFDGIVKRVEKMISEMKTLFIVEDLSNFVKSGRIGKIAALAVSSLPIRFVMGDDGDGNIKLVQKAIGSVGSLKKLIEKIVVCVSQRPLNSVRVVISECNCIQKAESIKNEIISRCKSLREVIIVPAAGVSTIYANNGGLVAAIV